MNRSFYRSEGLVEERAAAASNASKADAKDNLITIVRHLDEADVLLSASRSYVSASQTLLENLKKYVCVVEADINSSAEGITETGTRLQRMRSELQSLFQSVFYQDSGHDSRHEERERNVHNIQVTNSVSKHVLDTIREYAIDKSIDLNDYTMTWNEYGSVTFVILHPKNKPNDSFNQERDSVDNLTTNQKNISENCLGSSPSSNTANRKLINIKSSGNVYGISEGVECRNRRDAANMQKDALTESIAKIIERTDTARKMLQRDDEDPLPVNEHRQRSLREVVRKIIPYFQVSMNDSSSSNRLVQGKNSSIANLTEKPDISYDDFRPAYSCFQKSSVTDEHKSRNFTQTGSNLDEANSPMLTRCTEFTASEKAYLYKRSSREPNRSQRERRYSSKHNSSYQIKNSEKEKASGNTNLFVTPMPRTEDSMRTSHNFRDFLQNKENESKSVLNQPGADEEQSQIPPNRVLNKQVGVCPLWPVDTERARALATTNHISSKPEEKSLDPAKTSSGCLFEDNCITEILDELKGKLNRNGGHQINMSENWKNSSKTSKHLSKNESDSCFARRISSTNATPPFIWQKKPLMSFTNPRKPMSKSSQADTKKAMFSRKMEVSLIDEEVSCLLDKMAENGFCDSGNNFDSVVKGKQFSPNATLETTKKLNDGIVNNASKNSTFEMASDGISKTTVTSDTNMEYDPVTSRSVSSDSYRNGLTATRNHLRSFFSQEKKYSSYEKETPRKLPFISQRKVSEIKKSESRNSFGNKASKDSSSTHGIADFRNQEQLKLTKEESIRADFSDNSSIKSSSYLTCKDLSGLEDTKVLAEKFSDFCLVSDSVPFDSITESEYFNAPNVFDEYACRSRYENATDRNCATENTKSEIFHDVSSFCSDSATAANQSGSSLTLRGSACQLPDPIFTLNISRSAKLPRNDPLGFSSSLPARVPENIFKENRRSSKTTCSDFSRSNPESRTSTFPPPFTIKCFSTPISDSSSSQGDSP